MFQIIHSFKIKKTLRTNIQHILMMTIRLKDVSQQKRLNCWIHLFISIHNKLIGEMDRFEIADNILRIISINNNNNNNKNYYIEWGKRCNCGVQETLKERNRNEKSARHLLEYKQHSIKSEKCKPFELSISNHFRNKIHIIC